MSTKQVSGLGDIGPAIMDTQSNQQVIQNGHVVPSSTNREPGSIFMQGYISTVMQATLDAPILAGQSQQLSWRSFLGGQTGQAIHHLARAALGIFMPHFFFPTK